MAYWLLIGEKIGNSFCHFHRWSFNRALRLDFAPGATEQTSRDPKKEVLLIALQSGPSHGYVLLVAFKQWSTAQWIRASLSQGSMKGNNRMSVQNQRLYLHQQCPIKALTCIQAIQKPQPSISSQQFCSPGRVMHPNFHLCLLIGFREEKKPANGINFLMESS